MTEQEQIDQIAKGLTELINKGLATLEFKVVPYTTTEKYSGWTFAGIVQPTVNDAPRILLQKVTLDEKAFAAYLKTFGA